MAASGVYDISPDILREFAMQIDNLAGEYENLYNNNLFNSLVNTDLKEAYKGTDAETLVGRLESYRVPFAEMKKQLNAYADFLRSVAVSYIEAANTFAGEATNVGRN